MTYADGFFGSSEEYTKGFAAMFPGLEADYVGCSIKQHIVVMA